MFWFDIKMMFTFHKFRIETLYLNIIDVYLKSFSRFYDLNHDKFVLKRVVVWLKTNNFFVKKYVENIVSKTNTKFLVMFFNDFTKLQFFNRFDFLMIENEYDVETRNENFKYFRIFEEIDFRKFNAVIDKNHSNFEVFIFFVLYFIDRDHFQKNSRIFTQIFKQKTIFKNVKRKLNITILHFRNDWYWSHWMY